MQTIGAQSTPEPAVAPGAGQGAAPIGRVISPADGAYGPACATWNERWRSRPRQIVYCQTAAQVSAALRHAVAQRSPFRIRSGGHSVEGYSSVDDGIVIDVTDLDQITVNNDRTVAVVGSGARLGDVYRTLAKTNTTIPAGTCPNIGIAGHVLGGGLGMLTRSRGVLVDSLLALEMVDAEGRILTVNEESHPDLFWACRGGGGGNFGIVTSLTFRLAPISEIILFAMIWDWSDFEPALDAWQRWAPEADDRVNSIFAMMPQSAGFVAASGIFEGTQQELEPLLESLARACPPLEQSIDVMSFLDTVDTIADLQGAAATAKSVRAKGISAFVDRLFTADAIRSFKDAHADAPETALTAAYAMGGVLPRGRSDATAFIHRTERLCLEYRADWTDPAEDQAHLDWLEGIRKIMAPHTTGGAYVNTPDRSLEDWPYAYFGDNFARLVEIKHRYDPASVFTFPQGIPASLTLDEALALKLPDHLIAALRAAGRLTEQQKEHHA